MRRRIAWPCTPRASAPSRRICRRGSTCTATCTSTRSSAARKEWSNSRSSAPSGWAGSADPTDPAYKALLGQRMPIGEFSDLDDVSILHCFKLWSHGPDVALASLCRGLLFRRVFKTIDLSRFEDPRDARSVITAIERMVAERG